MSRFICPPGSTSHWNATKWYKGVALTPDEEGNLDTSQTRYAKISYVNKIRYWLQCIDKSYGWDEVAFINYFLRPADNGKNINDLWKHSNQGEKDLDRKYAIQNLLDTIMNLEPNLVIFTSDFVNDCAEGPFGNGDYKKFINKKEFLWKWMKDKKVDYIYINHPSAPKRLKGYSKALIPNSNNQYYTSKWFFINWLKNNW